MTRTMLLLIDKERATQEVISYPMTILYYFLQVGIFSSLPAHPTSGRLQTKVK
jgi:hypothetical protein